MKPKFTKGKWHLAYHPQEKFYSIHSMPSHPQDCGSNVLDENHIGKEEAIANANLICAAPEMLDILFQLIDSLEGNINPDDLPLYNEIECAKSIIKKATE